MLLPYLAAARPDTDAADLLARFGARAAAEARARAEHSRKQGNHIHFCRWREVGRLIATLREDRGGATLH